MPSFSSHLRGCERGVADASQASQRLCAAFPVLNEFYRVAFRNKVYLSIDDLRADLDCWAEEYNEARPHQGRWCFGKTPMQTFLHAMPMTREKMIAAYHVGH
jgi:hypothetical protein